MERIFQALLNVLVNSYVIDAKCATVSRKVTLYTERRISVYISKERAYFVNVQEIIFLLLILFYNSTSLITFCVILQNLHKFVTSLITLKNVYP